MSAQDRTLSETAIEALGTSREMSRAARSASGEADTPRHGNTGGSLRQGRSPALENMVGSDRDADPGYGVVPQTTPPTRRSSRRKKTSIHMDHFLDSWFFDWLSVTIPNGTDGKGRKADGIGADREADEAAKRLFSWVTVNGLRLMRIGKGTDGYAGGAHLAYDPTGSERIATVRDGHRTNMPGLELPGADGVCAELAPRALAELGAVLIARVDVSRDVSQAGLFDELHELCCEIADERGMDQPRVDGTIEKGRTVYFGAGEASVKIYEKDLERVAKGKIAMVDADRDLVRTEFMFRPKKGAKSGMARVARDEGAGALLGAVCWVRTFVERMAVLTHEAREREAHMAVTRIERTPDARTIAEKSAHGSAQYARTHCRAAVAQIVHDDFGGDWLRADIGYEQIFEAAIGLVSDDLRSAAAEIADDYGVLEVRDHEQEAERSQLRLDAYIDRQAEETQRAQIGLLMAEAAARQRCGVAA